MRLHPLHASPAPQVHTTATTPQPATHQDRRSQAQAEAQQSTAAYDASPSRLHSAARSSASLPLGTWACPATGPSRPPGMPLPRTQTRLLILIRQRQRIDQPTQQQTVILDDLQQRIRPRLPRIPSHHQRRARNSASSDVISSAVRHACRKISSSPAFNTNAAGHRVPQPPTSRS